MRTPSIMDALRNPVFILACLSFCLAPIAAAAFDVEAGSRGNQLSLRVFRGPEPAAQGALTITVAEAPAWVTSLAPRTVTVPAAASPGEMAEIAFRFDVAAEIPPGMTGRLVLAVRGAQERGGLVAAGRDEEVFLTVAAEAAPAQQTLAEDCCAALATVSTFVRPQRWMLFSVPVLPVPPDTAFVALSVLSDDLGPFFALRRWDPATGSLVNSSALAGGRGYFLRDNFGPPPESTLVDVNGAVLGATLTFEVAGLDSGFQELGNPYLTDLAWSGDVAVTGPGSVTVGLDSAVTLGWIEPVLWKLAADGTWRFHFVEDGDGAIAPWEGGLVLPRVHSLSLRYAGAAVASQLAAPPYLWRVELLAQAPGVGRVDAQNFFGVSPGAAVQYDRRDVLGPFRLENALELSFDNAGWLLYPGQYQQDVRPPSAGVETWPVGVTLAGAASQSITVTWPDLSQVPEQVELLLIDPAAADTADMRVESSYTFVSGSAGSSRALEIRADMTGLTEVAPAGAGVPTTYFLAQNQPNPFRPATEIRYGIPAGATGEVALRIYNVEGKRVRDLVRGPAAPGYHRVVWDGKSDSGAAVPSGIYFSRLETPQGLETRKMTLLR